MTSSPNPQVRLELADGLPTALTKAGRRWSIIDTPTALGNQAAVYSGLIHHPPRPWTGWRFTARDDAGEVMTFDTRIIDGEWEIIRVYR